MIIAKGGAHSLFILSKGQTFRLIQRLAAGGEKRPISGREKWPPSAAGDCRVPGWDKRGQDTGTGFLSPLDSPYLPLR